MDTKLLTILFVIYFMVIDIPLRCHGATTTVSDMMTAAVTARSGVSNKSQVRKHRPPERNEGQGTNLASTESKTLGPFKYTNQWALGSMQALYFSLWAKIRLPELIIERQPNPPFK